MLEINQGLQVPLVHVTYVPGSSVGNLNWIWHSLATDIDSALQTSQPLIEKLKKDIPQYHTSQLLVSYLGASVIVYVLF